MNPIVEIKEDSEGNLLITTSDKYAVADIATSLVETVKTTTIANLKNAIAAFEIDNIASIRALDDARDELANTELLIAKLSHDEAKQLANQIYVHLALKNLVK
jgi:hypothetical protein